MRNLFWFTCATLVVGAFAGDMPPLPPVPYIPNGALSPHSNDAIWLWKSFPKHKGPVTKVEPVPPVMSMSDRELADRFRTNRTGMNLPANRYPELDAWSKAFHKKHHRKLVIGTTAPKDFRK